MEGETLSPFDSFCLATVRVLARIGDEPFLPTLFEVEPNVIRALDEVPADVDDEVALQDWILLRELMGQHVCFAVLASDGSLVLAEMVDGLPRFFAFEQGHGFVAMERPAWWRL